MHDMHGAPSLSRTPSGTAEKLKSREQPKEFLASAPKVKKPQSKKKGNNGEGRLREPDIPDNEFYAKMKEAVLADRALHLRVLRYEPIHVDTFIQLAQRQDLPIRGHLKLKGRVRAFLDKQAIHYYGADATSRRTRRHP